MKGDFALEISVGTGKGDSSPVYRNINVVHGRQEGVEAFEQVTMILEETRELGHYFFRG